MSENGDRDGTQKLRAVLYARFSTDLQNERSIEDQISLCRSYAARENLEIINVFEDRARSGGSILGRDGLLALLSQAREKRFDVVVVEALDRLSRDMEDLASVYKRLTFLGIRILAVHEGVVNTVLVGLRGLVGQLYREDNAHKVRRGLAGRVNQGLIAGGLTYGYAAVPGEGGKRLIVESEAAVVRRVFEEFVGGRTPRDIAYGLNRDGIASPRGSSWNASTINGNPQRRTGILHNELYVGRLVWNRVRMIKDPDTGKRISRLNPKAVWQSADVPELAIISRGLFDSAQERKEARSVSHPSHQRRPKHALSGLLRCGVCGAGMSANGKDKSGRIRIRCSGAIERGTCPDPRTFYLETVENAVLSGLKAELRRPDVIAVYVRTYHDERQRLASEATANRARLERRLAANEREAEKITDYLIKGIGNVARLDARAKELMAEEQALRRELAAAPEPPKLPNLHPAVLARYEEQLERLQQAIDDGLRAGDSEAAEALRDLVERVTVFRDSSRPGGVEVEISGRLNALLGEEAFPNRRKGVWGKLVAAEGFEPPTKGL